MNKKEMRELLKQTVPSKKELMEIINDPNYSVTWKIKILSDYYAATKEPVKEKIKNWTRKKIEPAKKKIKVWIKKRKIELQYLKNVYGKKNKE